MTHYTQDIKLVECNINICYIFTQMYVKIFVFLTLKVPERRLNVFLQYYYVRTFKSE